MRAFRGSDRVIDLTSLAEWFWESQPERVKAPYGKGKRTRQDPEYHETRETLWGLVGDDNVCHLLSHIRIAPGAVEQRPHIQSRFHVSRPTLDTAMSTRLSLTGLSPSLVSFPKTVLLNLLNQFRGPNPGMHASRFGLFRFRSPLLTESHVVFSSSGYLDVSVHRVPLHTLWIGVWIHEVCSCGFPHSDIYGSKDICSSP